MVKKFGCPKGYRDIPFNERPNQSIMVYLSEKDKELFKDMAIMKQLPILKEGVSEFVQRDVSEG